jgi:hypothetical protein
MQGAESRWERYITSFYFIYATMTTVVSRCVPLREYPMRRR